MRCPRRLGGTLLCTAQLLKRYSDPEDLCGEEWELNNEATWEPFSAFVLPEGHLNSVLADYVSQNNL